MDATSGTSTAEGAILIPFHPCYLHLISIVVSFANSPFYMWQFVVGVILCLFFGWLLTWRFHKKSEPPPPPYSNDPYPPKYKKNDTAGGLPGRRYRARSRPYEGFQDTQDEIDFWPSQASEDETAETRVDR